MVVNNRNSNRGTSSSNSNKITTRPVRSLFLEHGPTEQFCRKCTLLTEKCSITFHCGARVMFLAGPPC